jgi:TrmH RNA methyltransferase
VKGQGPRPRPEHRRRDRPDPSVDRVHGFRAGLAVLATRPADVLRVACTREVFAEVERTLEGRKGSPPVRNEVSVVSEHELERIARSPQHEGLCLEARPRRWLSAQELGDRLAGTKGTKRPGVAIALDRVRNSYNIGAILRSAAFFGVDAALLGAPAPHPGLDPNAVRVAEGGAEHVALSRTTDLADTLSRLRARGIAVYGADGHAETSALGFRFARPAVLVLGNEREGIGPRVRAQCDALLGIQGTGAVESLNVAVAATVLICELTR